jgi:hypothetical protein
VYPSLGGSVTFRPAIGVGDGAEHAHRRSLGSDEEEMRYLDNSRDMAFGWRETPF